MMEDDSDSNHHGKLTTTISLGNLLTIVSILGSVGFVWVNLSSGITRIEEREATLETRLAHYDTDHDALVNLEAEVRTVIDQRATTNSRH